MKRTLLCTALLTSVIPSARALAQSSTSLPVIKAKVSELGEFRDTSLRALRIPEEAALSPRGNLIAYASRAEEDNLHIWNPSTHSDRVVLKGWVENVAWSPAGDAIVFTHDTEDGSQSHVWVLRVNPLTGESIGSARRLSVSPAGGWASPLFSPDGNSIVFARRDSVEQYAIVVVPASGGNERVLATSYGVRSLRWDAKGKGVYYVSYQGPTQTRVAVNRVALSGGTPQSVQVFTDLKGLPEVSSDNRVVMVPEPMTSVIRVLDPTGQALATVSLPPGVWTRDPSGAYRQVGIRETHPRGMRIVSIADGKARELIDSSTDVQEVSWFADSRRVAAIAFMDGAGVLVTMNSDGTGIRKIPLSSPPVRNANLFAPPVENLRVSPDGQHAVYLGCCAGLGGVSLVLVELSTGKQQVLSRAITLWQPFWSPDSKSVRYLRQGEFPRTERSLSVHEVSLDGNDRLVRAFLRSEYPGPVWLIGWNDVSLFGGTRTALAHVDGGTDQELRHASRSPGALSPDGQTMAVLTGPTGSVEPVRAVSLLSVSGGANRTLDLPFRTVGCGPFSPDSRYLYCDGRETDASPRLLYEVPVDGSKPRVVSQNNSREIRGAMALSPDGKWMLETVSGVRRAAFVLLDFTEGMNRLLSSPGNP